MNDELPFEEVFKALIEESEKIEIEYDYTIHYFKEESYARYDIKKINGVIPFIFKSKVLGLGKQGVEILKEQLNSVAYEFRVSYLEEAKEEILHLKSIVHVADFTRRGENGEEKEIQFKSFKSAHLIPSDPARQNGHEKSILKKASDCATAWESAIDEIAGKVEFLIHQIELLPEPKSAVKDKNTIHIFYSWQTDLISENRAIRKSLDKLVPHFKATGKTIKIDSDMRGTTGSLDITSTLFQKINSCDIFIADVNIVSVGLLRDAAYSPNANVLIELGYAAAKIGWDRVILMFNKTSYTIEQLPFDIRQRAVLWYDDYVQIEEKLRYAINQILKREDSN